MRDETSGLDGLRGLAAMMVVLSHTSIEGMTLLPALDFTGLGKLGVWLFFVLSAYLLTRQMLESGTPLAPRTLHRFFIRRFFRVYPLFAAVLLVEHAAGRLDAGALWRGLALVEGEGVFWTVPVEMQFYLLLPPIAFLFLRLKTRPLALAALCGGLFAVSLLFRSSDLVVTKYISLFLFGCVAALIGPRLADRPRQLSALALIGVILAVLTVPRVMTLLNLDLFIGTGTLRNTPQLYGPIWACVVLATVYAAPWRRIFSIAPMRWLGEISFSSYLLHELVLSQVAPWNLGPSAGFACVVLGTILLSSMVWLLLEQPARLVGYKLTGGLARRRTLNADARA